VYEIDSCGSSAMGVCLAGVTCDGPATGPVCGCDGSVVEGDQAVCERWVRGLPFAPASHCAGGTFPCSQELDCLADLEVCLHVSPGPAGSEPFQECVAIADLNTDCQGGIPSCACLGDLSALGCSTGSVCECSADANDQETVTIAQP
jgi:hypothetical protein